MSITESRTRETTTADAGTTDGSPSLEVRRLSAVIGAEIRGVDLRADVDAATVAELRRLLLEHKVLFFPAQHLNPAEHVAFARQFGELTAAHPVIPGLPNHPEVFELDYSLARSLPFGTNSRRYDNNAWHTDVTFVARPPLGSLLNAVVIPEAGGDTLFSNQEAAYEALSAPIRELLDGLTATHDGSRQFSELLKLRKLREADGGDWEGEQYAELRPVSHPVVRTHPETGRKGLFVNRGFTTHINELSARESDALLALLFDHSVRPEFTVRYHWQQGDLAFWDNRATQHSVVNDFTEHRVIQRVTVRGDAPF